MMDCEKMNHLLDDYLDGTLDETQRNEADRHLAECEECAMVVQVCGDLRTEEEEVPAEFSSGWRAAIKKEEKMEGKSQNKRNLRSVLAIAAALVFIVGGTALTRDNKTTDYITEREYGYTTANTAGGSVAYKRSSEPMLMMSMDNSAAEEAMAVPEEAAAREQKLIRRVDFTIRTLEFEQVVDKLQELTASMGGRVEYLSQYGDKSSGSMRNASLTLRIPSDRLNTFLTDVENVGNVTSFTSQVEDVTESYYDVQTRLETQLAKLERLQELLKAAEEVSDLIEIESSIADTQYMVDLYRGRLNGMDDDVDYSTVSVYVQETKVVETKEVSYWQRIGAGIKESLENGIEFLGDSVIFLLAMLPWIILITLIVLVVKKLIKKKK